MMRQMKKSVKNGIHEDDRGFRFYRIMNYPLPKHKEYFAYKEKIKIDLSQKSEFSRNNKNPNMEEYVGFIDNFGFLYKNFPFVKEIYLANSITFNALKNHSDIDIFVISETNRVRLTRLFMSCMMFIY